MAHVAAGLYARVRQLLPEMLKFGVVGGIGAVFDLGGAALLHGKYHVGPLEAKAASTATATVITYVGSRFWTFKDRENQELRREAALFIILNLVGLLIAEVVVALVTYVMGLHSQLEYNIASFLGTGFGTIFRYLAYRQWVFLAPAHEAPTAATAPARQAFSGPPWERDPAVRKGAAQAAASASVAVYPARLAQEPAASWDPALAPTMSWSAPAPETAPAPEPAPQPARVPAFDYFSPDSPAADVPAPGATASRFGAPAHDKRSPAPAPPPRAPRPSGGGRHRKS